MCFYNDDYDWAAEICREGREVSEEDRPCHECGKQIKAGQAAVKVYMQEHEFCQWPEENMCYEDFEACGEEHDKCPGHVCDFGETYLYFRCENCEKILMAIEKVEEEEGCPAYARRPALEGLGDALAKDETGKYAAKALYLYGVKWRGAE